MQVQYSCAYSNLIASNLEAMASNLLAFVFHVVATFLLDILAGRRHWQPFFALYVVKVRLQEPTDAVPSMEASPVYSTLCSSPSPLVPAFNYGIHREPGSYS